jgi:tetratricopeptide (TPR) repeat protein
MNTLRSYGMKSDGFKTVINRRILRALVMTVALFALFTSRGMQGIAFAQDLKSLLAEGDVYAENKFDDRKALEIYKKAESLDPKNYGVLWRISRAYVDIAEHLPAGNDEQRKEQLSMYHLSLDYAEKTIKANASGMMGYLRRAISNGRVALSKGVFSQIGLIKEVKADVEKAIQLHNEDTHQLAVAHYVLARAHDKVCEKAYLVRLPLGLGWGDRKTDMDEYEKAISLNQDFIMFRLDAARNYIEMSEYQKAKEHLYKIPKLGVHDEDDVQFKKEAAALLLEIKNK